MARSCERRVLGADADRQDGGVGRGEDERKPRQAEAQRQHGDLADDDQ